MNSSRADLWRRIALTAWIVLAVAASIKTIAEPQLHTVYTAFSHACRDWWSGQSMYENRAYYYSPTFAVLMTPFAVWPDWLGGVFWTWASVGLLAWGLKVFFRDVLSQGVNGAAPTAALSQGERERDVGLLSPDAEGPFQLLVLVGTVRSVWSGQSNAILMALVLLAAAAVVRQNWWRGAAYLAAPIYIKIWPVVVAGLFTVQWPKRLVARVAIGAAVLGAVPYLTKSTADVAESYRQWSHCLTSRQGDDFRFPGYRDAWTLWEQIHSPVDKRAYAGLQLSAAVLVLAWCVWQRRRIASVRRLAIYTIAAWSAWQLLFGPGTERLTYNIIAPSLAWAVLTSIENRRGERWAVLAYGTTYILGVGGVERLLTRFVPASIALEPVGVLMFVGWLTWHATLTEDNRATDADAPAKLIRAA